MPSKDPSTTWTEIHRDQTEVNPKRWWEAFWTTGGDLQDDVNVGEYKDPRKGPPTLYGDPHLLPWGVENGQVVPVHWTGSPNPTTLIFWFNGSEYNKHNDVLIVPPSAFVKTLDDSLSLYYGGTYITPQRLVDLLQENGTAVGRDDLDKMVPDLTARWKEAVKSEQEQAESKGDDRESEEPQTKKPRTDPEEL